MTKKLGLPKVGRARLYGDLPKVPKPVDPNAPPKRPVGRPPKPIDPDAPKKWPVGRPRKGKKNSLALRRLWADPESRKKMMVTLRANHAKTAIERKQNPEKYSRAGTPNGMTRDTAAPLWAEARRKADRFIQMITDEGMISPVVIPDSDEAKGVAALHEACVLALGPGEKQAKLAALRTVLEYTRSKPESKSKVTINTSEQFLAEIAAADAAEG
jgi:hypothetical protein